MNKNIALAGNPNSGKTTLYNLLTGSVQYVGNWPGVTVEKKAAKYKKDDTLTIVDLPGVYSLSPYTLEEVVSRNYLIDEKPDAILNVVDASNLERNLYLTTQLLELNLPAVLALNMMDIVEKNGDKIDKEKLAENLGCKVVEISALKGKNIDSLMQEVKNEAEKKSNSSKVVFSKEVEDVISKIIDISDKIKSSFDARWLAIKIFERDELIMEKMDFSSEEKEKIEKIIEDLEEKLDDDSESIIINERYGFIAKALSNALIKKPVKETLSDRIDKIVTNRVLALPIFLLIMWAVYYVSMAWVGKLGSDYLNDVFFGEIVPGFATNICESVNLSPFLTSLIVDGIIGGVGAVLGFLPLIIVLYFFLSILEDVGYMARIAFIMDRIFRRFGLSGKSFIPILVGVGCSIPGLMATRTIENEKDRRMTLIVTSFMPCGAKAPIIAMIAAVAFGNAAWVAPVTYFIGLCAIIISGIILKKSKLFHSDPAPFVMELPKYHMPSARNVFLHTWERTKSFAIKAGTIILASAIVMWLFMSFNTSFEMIDFNEAGTSSILASVGTAIAPIFRPIGFDTWQAAVATFTGWIAKENVVSTMGIMAGLGQETIDAAVEGEVDTAFVSSAIGMFGGSAVAAFSFVLFNLFCIPCFAAVGAIRREMNSPKWTLIALSYQMLFAYAVSFVVYQLGIVVIYKTGINVLTILAALVLLAGLYLLFRPMKEEQDFKGYEIGKNRI